VTHLGWGRRLKDGKITDELAVIFFVREKAVTDGELLVLGTQRIPSKTDSGFATDVIQVRAVSSLRQAKSWKGG